MNVEFVTSAVVEQAAFLSFEAKLVSDCDFYRDAVGDRRERKIVIAQALRQVVQMIRDRTNRRVHRARTAIRSSTARSVSITSDNIRSDDSPRQHDTIKDEVVDDFVPIGTLQEEPVSASELHVRLSRRLNNGRPTLSFQTYLWTLTSTSKSMAAETDLTDTLSYEELKHIAEEHLGFNSTVEVMFVEYGPRHKPEWLFIQDDASFCSTVKTWHVEHPKTCIVQILISIRPGWIRAPGDEDEDEEEEDGDGEDQEGNVRMSEEREDDDDDEGSDENSIE